MNIFIKLLIAGLFLISLAFMPRMGAEILAQVNVPTTESQDASAKLSALNTASWGYWGPNRYWTELQ